MIVKSTLAGALTLLCVGCAQQRSAPSAPLVGAWRSHVQFQSGAFAAIQDLEFMFVFNTGGTLTESSNYDGAPPVPPAYGVWRELGPNQFEARYEFFATAPPATFDALKGGGGWTPAGRGVLTERIAVAPDGESFTSTLHYDAFDAGGQPTAGSGDATGRAVKIHF